MLEELKEYYKNLLIVQYHDKPKAKKTVELLTQLLYGDTVLQQEILYGFDWKTAVGKQLDVLCKWEGIDRVITYSPFLEKSWFALINETGASDEDLQGGFSTEETFETPIGGFLTEEDMADGFRFLDDKTTRFLLGFKIIKNHIKHTAKSIDEAIYGYSNLLLENTQKENEKGLEVDKWKFPHMIKPIKTKWDIQNRKLQYLCDTDMFDFMQLAKIKKVLPCPMPVDIEVINYDTV